jgi:hypothetical protein
MKYYVATYGRMGLEVEFFSCVQDYDAAVKDAEEAHHADQIDTWTCGEVQ